jgi:hypothetical protein
VFSQNRRSRRIADRIDQKIRLLLTLQKFDADRDRASETLRRGEKNGAEAEESDEGQ